MIFQDRVKLWRRYLYETGRDCGMYLSDVGYYDLALERREAIEDIAHHLALQDVIPVRVADRTSFWTLWDTNRTFKRVV